MGQEDDYGPSSTPEDMGVSIVQQDLVTSKVPTPSSRFVSAQQGDYRPPSTRQDIAVDNSHQKGGNISEGRPRRSRSREISFIKNVHLSLSLQVYLHFTRHLSMGKTLQVCHLTVCYYQTRCSRG